MKWFLEDLIGAVSLVVLLAVCLWAPELARSPTLTDYHNE